MCTLGECVNRGVSMSSAVTQDFDRSQKPYPCSKLCPIRSKSCPTFRYKHVTPNNQYLYNQAAQELIKTKSLALLYLDNQTTSYCGQAIDAEYLKKLVQSKGIRVFTSHVYVHTHETIPPGSLFLQFTTKNPDLRLL